MTRSLRLQIEEAWFGPGAACDVAAKLNEGLPAPKRISPDHVRRIWSQMRIPNVIRPQNGWEYGSETGRLLRQLGRMLARRSVPLNAGRAA